MTKFTKGDKATLLGSLDNKGTVFHRDVIVHSCGRKQMVLTDATTGEELGRHFAPVVGTLAVVTSFNWQATFHRMTEQEATEAALRLGAMIVAYEAGRLNQCIERSPGDARYVAAIRRDLAELHEPRALRLPA